MYHILWHDTLYEACSYYEALKAIRQFYPGGQIVPA